ncbi:hypothetical protein Bpfe_004287, partial [Biomphalaria pfeifferi]
MEESGSEVCPSVRLFQTKLFSEVSTVRPLSLSLSVARPGILCYLSQIFFLSVGLHTHEAP